MTKYNERLNEIIGDLSGESFDAAINNSKDYAQIVIDAETKSKQAITSLIKELVEESKPTYTVVENEIQSIRSGAKNIAINEFEQNLLKALEEV